MIPVTWMSLWISPAHGIDNIVIVKNPEYASPNPLPPDTETLSPLPPFSLRVYLKIPEGAPLIT